MFIIFGWGSDSPIDYGPALPVKCPNCHNKAYWHLVHRKKWFRVFFIPLIPFEDRWALLCSVCSRGMEIGSEDVPLAEKLTVLTARFMDRRVSLADYMKEIEACSLDVPWIAPAEPSADTLPAEEAQTLSKAGPWVCEHCGEESPESFRECWNCARPRPGESAAEEPKIEEAVPELERMKRNQYNPFGTLPL